MTDRTTISVPKDLRDRIAQQGTADDSLADVIERALEESGDRRRSERRGLQ